MSSKQSLYRFQKGIWCYSMAKKNSSLGSFKKFFDTQLKSTPTFFLIISSLYFIITCLCAGEIIKTTTLVLLIATLVFASLLSPSLRERINLPVIALFLYVLMGSISTFYANSGKFALSESLKQIAAFCLALLLLGLACEKNSRPGHRMASVLEVSAALAGLISIDLLSTRILSGLFLSLLGLFTNSYVGLEGVEAGIRMTSLFANPNIFAGYVGIGVLLSLGLVQSSENSKDRLFHLVCLFINALSFLLAFSMGASAFIAVAFLIYLIAETKDRRASLFVLMLETLVTTLAAAACISATSFDVWSGMQPIPLLLVAAGAAALCVLDGKIGRRLGETLSSHSKALLIAMAAILLSVFAFAVIALNVTGEAVLQQGEALRRAEYPTPGEYTLTAEGTGSVNITVESQNRQQTMMHTSTVLYQGALSEAVFTVPEDSLVVYFNFTATEPATLNAVTATGAESYSIPLDYKLLPGFIANRLQGLMANQNAIQRTVFFEDGMKLFMRDPLLGAGLGGFENGVKSVQSFYYATKYAHNHYIQALCDTGVIGFVLFVALLAISFAATLFARKRSGDDPLIPVLTAVLVYMGGHAFVEVCFSSYAYLPMAFGAFALINVCCGDAIPVPKLTSFAKNCSLGVAAAFLLACCGFLFSNISLSTTVSKSPTMENLAMAADKDPFEYADYMLSYVVNAKQFMDDVDVQEKALAYADKLSKISSNTIPYYLADYYFAAGYPNEGFDMVEQYVRYTSSDSACWEQAIRLLMANADVSDTYRAGLTRIVSILQEWNNNNLGEITLPQTQLDFLAIFELYP